MRVLVTGGAGYVGSQTVKSLSLKSGMKACVFDNLDRGHEWAVKWSPLIKADLADKQAICDALSDRQIEAVIHFAAHSCVGESMDNPRLYIRNNVINTMQLLEAMHEVGVNKIVFSSTAATYGKAIKTPISEDYPKLPVNPYGDTKLFVEKALHWYGVAHGLKWVALRYFNAAGADPEGEIGEVHDPETHLIPLVIQAALGKRPQIDIFGTDYDTPDGTAIRDYIHVSDLADAHLKALEHLVTGGNNIALNLGTSQGNSVKEVIRAVEKISGKKVPQNEKKRRAGDPPVLVADSKQAQKTLQWKPRYSSIETIVKHAWQWEEKR